MTQVRDFSTDLEFSEKASCEPFWKAVYDKAFPNIVNQMPCPGDTVSQRMGIDRLVMLSNGFTIAIDEKKRRDNYGDISLEYRHVYANGDTSPGWIEKDLSIDYLAYAIMPTLSCYLLPWQTLKRVWNTKGKEWTRLGIETFKAREKAKKEAKGKRYDYPKNGFDISISPNRGYKSYGVCVKPDILFATMNEYSIIDVSVELSDWTPPEDDNE